MGGMRGRKNLIKVRPKEEGSYSALACQKS